MLYLNGGMPRSGTVWVLHVIDMLARKSGTRIAKLNANTPAQLAAAITGYRHGEDRLIHYHFVCDSVFRISDEGFCRAFYNYRDPRDIVVSQMKLHGVPFDVAVGMTVSACRSFREALKIPRVMLISYTQIIQTPAQTVSSIAGHLGLVVDDQEVEAICREASMDNARKVMQKVLSGQGPIISASTGYREIKYDPDYFITDRHIQSGKIGRWKDELTPRQQLMVSAAFKDFSFLFSYDNQ